MPIEDQPLRHRSVRFVNVLRRHLPAPMIPTEVLSWRAKSSTIHNSRRLARHHEGFTIPRLQQALTTFMGDQVLGRRSMHQLLLIRRAAMATRLWGEESTCKRFWFLLVGYTHHKTWLNYEG